MEGGIHTCQICGRVIKANTGIIAHHGYKRPHLGWQTASCYGARGLPYEVSSNLIPSAIEQVVVHIQKTSERLENFKVNPPEKLMITRAYLTNPKEVTRPEGFVYDPQSCVTRPYTYENQYYSEIMAMQRMIRANIEFKNYLEERLKNWVKKA